MSLCVRRRSIFILSPREEEEGTAGNQLVSSRFARDEEC